MWIFTEFGILMPSVRPAHTIAEGDLATFQIRTRRRYELDYLRTKYMPKTLGPTIFLGNADYQYRAYCTPEAWASAMALMSLDIDYTKFKPTTDRHEKNGGAALHMLYNRVWGAVLDAFPTGSSYDTPKWTRKTTKTKTTKRTVDIVEPEMNWCEIPHGRNSFCHKMNGHKGACAVIALR